MGAHTPADQMKPLPQLPGLGGTYWAATGSMGVNSKPPASRLTDGQWISTFTANFEPPSWESSQHGATEPVAPVATHPQQADVLRREAALLGVLSPYG